MQLLGKWYQMSAKFGQVTKRNCSFRSGSLWTIGGCCILRKKTFSPITHRSILRKWVDAVHYIESYVHVLRDGFTLPWVSLNTWRLLWRHFSAFILSPSLRSFGAIWIPLYKIIWCHGWISQRKKKEREAPRHKFDIESTYTWCWTNKHSHVIMYVVVLRESLRGLEGRRQEAVPAQFLGAVVTYRLHPRESCACKEDGGCSSDKG